MEELSLELTHELLNIVESDNMKQLLEEFIVLHGFNESEGK